MMTTKLSLKLNPNTNPNPPEVLAFYSPTPDHHSMQSSPVILFANLPPLLHLRKSHHTPPVPAAARSADKSNLLQQSCLAAAALQP
jgi:hypothetical protein